MGAPAYSRGILRSAASVARLERLITMRVLPVVLAINGERNEVLGWRKGRADIHEIVVRVQTDNAADATEIVCQTMADFFEIPREGVRCVRGETERHKEFLVDIDVDRLTRYLP